MKRMSVLLYFSTTVGQAACQNRCPFYYGDMPKVSQEHLDRRRQQILDAAGGCFARQGFHATSMQDIFAAAGLSAGAVYRYFPTKTGLIREIAVQALAQALPALDRAAGQGAGLPGVLAAVV